MLDLEQAKNLEIGLDRDLFLRDLIRELTGSLEEIVGVEEASGYISLVGQRIGENLNERYRKSLSVDRLDRESLARVLVALKGAIQGDFSVVHLDEEQIVLKNTRCPFGDHVKGRPSLCMMTSNVFGTLVADNLGYARVELAETIASGDDGCKVVISLNPSAGRESRSGREYFGDDT